LQTFTFFLKKCLRYKRSKFNHRQVKLIIATCLRKDKSKILCTFLYTFIDIHFSYITLVKKTAPLWYSQYLKNFPNYNSYYIVFNLRHLYYHSKRFTTVNNYNVIFSVYLSHHASFTWYLKHNFRISIISGIFRYLYNYRLIPVHL
jgi:hypothetical protein